MRKTVPLFVPAILILLPLAASAQTTHEVDQVSISFSPNDLTIEAGDIVRWVWSAGSHTVTSGTGLADPDIGILFDAPLNSANTTFEFTFDTPGDYPYFCRPHVGLGMTGVIRVNAVSAADDLPAAAAIRMAPPFPNPFNPRVEIRFTPAAAGPVDLAVFDVRGRRVRTLLSGEHREATDQSVAWDGTDDAGAAVPGGTYLFRVLSAGRTAVVKGQLVR